MKVLQTLFFMGVLMIAGGVVNASCETTQITGKALADELWESIDKAVSPSLYENDPVLYAEKLSHYSWFLFGKDGFLRQSYTGVFKDNPELEDEFVACVVAGFGSQSTRIDFKWFFALEPYATPWCGFEKNVLDDTIGLKRFTISLAKHLSFAFAEDYQLLARYQYALAWRGVYIRGSFDFPRNPGFKFARFTQSLEDVARRLLGKGELYWVDVRNFMVSAYSTTGEQHLPKGKAGLEKIPELLKDWALCIGERGQYLRPSPFQPVWRLDLDLEKTGYGYVMFLKGDLRALPELILVPSRPFPDGPDKPIPNSIGIYSE